MLAVISNGLGEVVYARLARLGLSDYFDAVVVSSEVGVAKPNPAIFEAAFERLGSPDKATTLMVGDSLTSDIAGGSAFGIDTCWYNPPPPPTGGGRQVHVRSRRARRAAAIVGVGD